MNSELLRRTEANDVNCPSLVRDARKTGHVCCSSEACLLACHHLHLLVPWNYLQKSPHLLLLLLLQCFLRRHVHHHQVEKICIYRALNFVLFWAVAVVGFALRAGKEGLDAGTKLVPETVPRPVAQVGVGLVGVFMVTYFLRYLFTTALFILVIGVFSYMAYLFLNKDNDSTGGGGGGGDSGTSDDPVEEARRIMEKYK
ncbi:unnamed protein product [Sphagnum compactum]